MDTDLQITPDAFERIILKKIFDDEGVRNTIIPHLKSELFLDPLTASVVKRATEYVDEYNNWPSPKDLILYSNADPDIRNSLITVAKTDATGYSSELVLDSIENFFRNRLKYAYAGDLQLAMEEDPSSSDEIVDKIVEAQNFKFDHDYGMDVFGNPSRSFSEIHESFQPTPTGLKTLDEHTSGGIHNKSLTLIMAPTNMGKTLVMNSIATNLAMSGARVLYVTLEMSEAKITQRILRNALDLTSKDLFTMNEASFMMRMEELKKTLNPCFFVKEWDTMTANTNHIRSYMKEIYRRYGILFDAVVVDYLQILTPFKHLFKANSNDEMRIITAELRALASEFNVPVLSGVQTNRGGVGNSELSLSDIADGFSSTTIADIIWAVTQTTEQRENGIYSFDMLKNRYGTNWKNVVIGVDYEKMRIFDIDQNVIESQNQKSINSGVSDGVGLLMGKTNDSVISTGISI